MSFASQPNDIAKRRPGKTAQARRLRQEETETEFRLRSELRNRNLNGYKFARQVPLGPYIADFVCRGHRLVIELDGSQHADDPIDEIRTCYLCSHGYSVLRFWNHEVLKERRAVLDTVLAALEGRLIGHGNAMRFTQAHKARAAPLFRVGGPVARRAG